MSITTEQQRRFTHDRGGTAEGIWTVALAERSAGDGVHDLAVTLDGARRVVVVAPHPDDETLGAGGLMAMASAGGAAVTVVSCTDGEAAYPVDDLGPLRRLELDRSLHRLTRSRSVDVVELGLPDGSVGAHLGALVRSIATSIRDADLVVGPWASDGHPDHEAVGRACEHACAAAGVSLYSYPVWAWHWGTPELFDDLDLAQLELTRSARSAKADALGAFVTQTVGMGTGPILTADVLTHFDRSHEVFVRTEP